MQTHLRKLAVVAALTIGTGGLALAQQDGRTQTPGDREGSMRAQRTDPDTYANHPDYSNSDYYRNGNDEGYQDYKAKKRREKHEHQYRNDEDRKAHDSGYREGWSGRSYRDTQANRNERTGASDQNTNRQPDRIDQKHDKLDDRDAH